MPRLHTYAARLAFRMEQLGISIPALARRIGRSPGAVHSWARPGSIRKPQIESRRAIATALNCDPDWLLTGNGPIPTVIPGIVRAQDEVAAREIYTDDETLGFEHDEAFLASQARQPAHAAAYSVNAAREQLIQALALANGVEPSSVILSWSITSPAVAA